MADLLTTSISGLMAFQRALNTTSHNITNANTVGYSRQLPEFMTRQAHASGSGWVGNGVDVSTITRAYDEFRSSQARSASSTFQQASTFATQVERISKLFGDSSTGLSASLQSFVNAMQSVADSPNSTPARQTLLSQAQTLADRLRGYDTSLRNFDAQTNDVIERETQAITTLAQNIAQLNQQISNGYAQFRQPPNDLLDQRDRLIDELATHIDVSVVKQGDNSVNVFIGNGQPLVVGQTSATVLATSDPFDPTRKTVSVRSATGTADISGTLSGGVLGGMLDFRKQVLDPARNTLGRLAAGLTEVVNEQHRRGMDLNGNLGGDFFGVGGVDVQTRANNGGDASAVVTRVPGEAGALTTSDYMLVATSGGWDLRRTDTGATVPMTGTGTSADPFRADGLEIVVSGTPQTGDQILIKPTANAVSGFNVLINDTSLIAAAAPIATSVGANNTGNASISAGEVTDRNTFDLSADVTLQFTSATTYTVNGDPTVYTLPANGEINGPGWRVQINGTPAAGDTFTVSDNPNGVGDNRNALLLADIMKQPVLNGGNVSINSAVGQFVGHIGVVTNQAQVTRDAAQVVADEAAAAMQAVSGVNLDEEAANLIRYQQAYMAMAQMIRVADTIFQSVLDATRG